MRKHFSTPEQTEEAGDEKASEMKKKPQKTADLPKRCRVFVVAQTANILHFGPQNVKQSGNTRNFKMPF